VDLGVFEADFYKKLPKLFDNFKEKGYHVSYKAGIDEIIQIFIPDMWVQNEYRDFGTPTLDIFPWSRSKDKVRLHSLKHRYLWGGCWHHNSHLFPLKSYNYDGLQVWGPNNPIPYLDRFYIDWDKIVIVEVRRMKNKSEKVIFDLQEVRKMKSESLHDGEIAP